jgi:WD40 repeat protein/serine/threonine protein kinase
VGSRLALRGGLVAERANLKNLPKRVAHFFPKRGIESSPRTGAFLMSNSKPELPSLFGEALECPSAEARIAFLERACHGDAALRAHVEALLQAHQQVGGFLRGHSAPSGPVATVDEPLTERPGTVIGPYTLREQIGEGGMGLVFVAEQQQPVRRKVALKVIKPGMDSRQVIARFEAERQALALMDHPNIARVLDAGTTESGRPYFVMEFVKGVCLTDYCDQNRLTTQKRLELFLTVCQAVQHAHQKGVIHRDLKPSNILVTVHDVTPVVKVIDFGIAKAIGQQLTEKTVYTGVAQLVGTPQYMSPEQAGQSGLDVDTRSDIYSLGVLLYELLTGTTPFEKERLHMVNYDEMRRIIREDDPPRPSTRLSTLEQGALSTTSANRSVDPPKLRREVRGELDWIVMKALEKDRTRRYETANSLARDLQRSLAGEPVEACPLTAGYRLRKFARKNQKLLVTAAAFAVLLLLGVVGSTWQAVRATQAEAVALAERDEKEQARQRATQAEVLALAERDEKEQARQSAAEQRAAAVQSEQVAQQERDKAQQQRDEVRALNNRLQSTLYAAHMNVAQHAWAAGNIQRVQELLEEHRPKAGESDLRSFEWHYLNRLCHAEILSVQGTAVFSPDGKRLASAAAIGPGILPAGRGPGIPPAGRGPGIPPEVKLWDVQTGLVLLTIKGAGIPAAFSPDGKRLATFGSDGIPGQRRGPGVGQPRDPGVVKLWDAQTGQELLSLKDAGGSLAFSPDGKRLVTVDDKTVKIWDAQTGQVLLSLKDAGGSSVFSPDGKRLATSDDKTVKIWDAQTGQELLSLKGTDGVVFSPDGKRLASAGRGEEGMVKVWDAQTGQELLSLKAAWSSNVVFSPDGKRLASASERHVKVWDAQTGQKLLSCKGHNGQINSVAFSPDGKRLASAGWDRMVHVWDAQTGQELLTYKGHSGMIRSVAFSPDGNRLASAAMDGTVKVWDATTSPEARTFTGPAGEVHGVVFSPDGKRLASNGKVWDAQTGQELLSLKGAGRSVAFSPDGKRLATGSNVWDAQTGQELLTLKGGGGWVAYSPDGKRLAGAAREKLANGSWDTTAKVWDAQTGQELFSFKIGPSSGLAFSPDGKRLASASGLWQGMPKGWDGTPGDVKVWDVQTGQLLLTLKGYAGPYASLAFSPDGRLLASSNRPSGSAGPTGSGEVKVWDAQTGRELLTLKGHIAEIASVVFSPDGKRLASSARWTDTVQVWDAQTGQELLNLKAGGEIDSLAFSPDGHWLVGDPGGKLTIWDATPLPAKP